MSVVGPEFEQLRRFNLAELRDASNGRGEKGPDTTDESRVLSSAKDIGAGD